MKKDVLAGISLIPLIWMIKCALKKKKKKKKKRVEK